LKDKEQKKEKKKKQQSKKKSLYKLMFIHKHPTCRPI